MKKVLIISYLFPPAGGVMVQRVLKFVKYLPNFGWQPTVLTVGNPDYRLLDPELINDVPKNIKIIRTRTIEPSKIYNFFTNRGLGIRTFLSRNRSTGQSEFDITPKLRLATQISNFIFIPDNRVGWVPFASATLRKLKGYKFDMIFSTSPPFSVHLVGLIAKFLLKKPWVIDFRDLWILDPQIKPSTRIHYRISRHIEHRVLEFADRIILVSEPLCEDLKKTYPDITSEKFVVIPNGYDVDDFKVDIDKRNKKFSIGHVGSLRKFTGRTPYYFLTALADLKKEVPDLEKTMEVLFVGTIDSETKEIINKIASKFRLQNVIRCIDHVSHHQAISYMKKLHVLLFLMIKCGKDGPSTRGYFSGKLYEYLATGKPILALTIEEPIRNLIQKSGCGILVKHDDIKIIKKEILNCYNKFREGRLEVEPNWDFIAQFERSKLTHKLAKIFDELSK